MILSQYVFFIGAFILALIILGYVGRLVAGPTMGDRLVVFDAINTVVSCIMLLLAVVYDSVVMVDVAIVYMAISFVSILYFARRMEGGI
jgi:multicomponent Na+:H+ antiporter subunit F